MPPDASIADPSYQEALRWLYGLSPNIRTAAQIVADHPRKLARMAALLERVGRPDRQFESVLVAGTKGKGSISALSESILRAAGRRTGLVTSPHLVSWCERTRIDGHEIDPSAVAPVMAPVRAAVERLSEERPELGQATTFEAGLAFSLLAFAERGVEIAVVEAGVGGLHDATNVLDPLAIALGPISYDHTATLGPTLTAIAGEKTGVFRPGRLAISAEQPPEALIVVERAAQERGAVLELLGQTWTWSAHRPDEDQPCRGTFTVAGPRGTFEDLTTPLLGRHQRDNTTVAVALTTDVLAKHPATTRQRPPAGDAAEPTTDTAVREGLASVRWPGRLQIVREQPLLVVDGAHNGASAVRLAEGLRDCFAGRRRHLVLGMSIGKDVARMLDALLPVVSTVTLTRSHHDRSASLDQLKQTVEARGIAASIVPEVRDAVARALDWAEPEDLVIVTGSLFVVGEALEAYDPAMVKGT
jgi:dihydrofolate synthase/folylpolyglutamate synthase